MEIQIKHQKWGWIGHTLTKSPSSITHPYLEPPGQEEKRTSNKLLEARSRSNATGTRNDLERWHHNSPEPCAWDERLLLMAYVPHGTSKKPLEAGCRGRATGTRYDLK